MTRTRARALANWPNNAVSVLDYGAVGDGVTDDRAAIQSALDSGNTSIFIPEGEYIISDTLNVPSGVSLKGAGSGSTLIRYTGSSRYGIDVTPAPWSSLSLAAGVVVGNNQATFANTAGLSRGDIVCFVGGNLGFREYYADGSLNKVAKVDGNTVTFENAFVEAWATSIGAYRATFGRAEFKGFSLYSKMSTSDVYTGFRVATTSGTIDDVAVFDASYNCCSINVCYELGISNSTFKSDPDEAFGGDYGFVISNSSSITVSQSFMTGARHGFATGGSNEAVNPPNRGITVDSCVVSGGTGLSSSGFDFHGNLIGGTVTNCVINNGAKLAGQDTIFSSNVVNGSNFYAFGYSELIGMNHTVSDNVIAINGYSGDTNRGMAVDIGGNSSVITTDTTRSGCLSIINNRFTAAVSPPSDDGKSYNLVRIQTKETPTINKSSIVISGNSFNSYETSAKFPFSIFIRSLVTTEDEEGVLGSIQIDNNSLIGGINVFNYSTNEFVSSTLRVHNNTIAGGTSCFFYGAKYTTVIDNLFDRQSDGVSISNARGDVRGKYTKVTGNSLTNLEASTTVYSAFYAGRADYVWMSDNFSGGGSPTVTYCAAITEAGTGILGFNYSEYSSASTNNADTTIDPYA